MRVLLILIDALLWLLLFMIPAGVLGFIASMIYKYSPDYLFISTTIAILGVYLGVHLAEYIRRKHGLESFFSKYLFTSELE